MLNTVIHTLLFSFFLVIAAVTDFSLDSYAPIQRKHADEREVLYLPNGTGLKVLSLGYDNALANLLWFKTISYFGKHHATDRNYKWLAHMCDVITSINPRMRHVYQFGALMLAWEVKLPREANALLSKAIQHHPDDWQFYYLRGFNSLYFLQDNTAAARDFASGAKLPGAHVVVKSLAAKNLAKVTSDPNSAIEFLSEMVVRATDEHERAVLQERLKEAYRESGIRSLARAVEQFESKNGRKPSSLQELVSTGIVADIGPDPFGGRYYYDQNSSSVTSTSLDNKKKRSE